MCREIKELAEGKIQPNSIALAGTVATLNAQLKPVSSWRVTMNATNIDLVFLYLKKGGRYLLFIDVPSAQTNTLNLPGGAKTPAGATSIVLAPTMAQTFVVEFTMLAANEYSVWLEGSAGATIAAGTLKAPAALSTTLQQISDQAPSNSQLFLATDKSAFLGSLSVGQSSAPAARLDVKGIGATSATKALNVLNGSGGQIMRCDDDGNVYFGGSSQAKMSSVGQLCMDTWKSKTSFEDDKLEWLTDELTLFFANTQFASFKGSGAIFGGNGAALLPTAMLQVDSTNRGFLPPRMTTAQRIAISFPANGLVVFDTTLNELCFYRTSDSTWRKTTNVAA